MTTQHHVVGLDAWVEPPPLDFPHTLHLIRDGTALSNPEQIKDATILINSQVPVTRELIQHGPKVQLVACTGTGINHVNQAALRERGITLCKVPAQNVDTVSEHALALYFALKRELLPMHQLTMEGKRWAELRTPHVAFQSLPRTNAEETLVSQNIEKIAKALGMKVIVSERKDATQCREGRVLFQDALRQGTVFVLVVPFDASTKNMIGNDELKAMKKTALLVNVGRGGVVNEPALAEALKSREIAGAATDVFSTEPATKENSPLLDPTIPNILLTPHVAWFSSSTIKGTMRTVKANVEGWVAGRPQNVVTSA